MPDTASTSRAELLRIIRSARRRWRLRVALRGLAAVVAGGLVVLVAAAYGLEYFAFSPASITAFRVVLFVVLAALAVAALVRPLLRSVPDERIALYVEEHEPSLEASLLSAVDAAAPASSGEARSAALVARLVRDAIERAHAVEDGRRIERGGLRAASAVIVVAAGVGLFAAAAGPAFLRHAARALLEPWRAAPDVAPYRLAVRPGSVTVARGADQAVSARLVGFSSGGADLLVRGADGGYERVPMTRTAGDSAAFDAILFDLQRGTDYFVEAGGVRSPLYHIDVADLPYARRLDVEYRYPAYAHLPPRTVEDAGDLAALRGTVARLRVVTTIPAAGGRIVRADGRAFPLRPDGPLALAAAVPLDRPGSYHVELQAPDGRPVEGSPEHTIEILEDEPPTVTFDKPGRDVRATNVDELFLQARAADDYGVARLDLVYAVNGGEEKTLGLYAPKAAPLREVSAGRTFYLEEMGLQPGDLVAYYARATDGGPDGRASGSTTSDIYFVRIRDFRKDYHAAEQRGAPGGGQGQQDGALSERQKEVISATFNLKRDAPSLAENDRREHRTTIQLAQARLRGEVDGLVRRMQERRVATIDSTFLRIMDVLPRASAAMMEAETQLDSGRVAEALSPEQRALRHLQAAEELYRDVQVSLGDSQGGGGGGAGQTADDLADMFQLEMDRLRNQYESVQRGRDEQTQQELDATMERLKELARRQLQAAERQRRLSRQGSAGSGGGAAADQRQLADSVDAEARRLERLAHEDPQRRESLEQAAHRLRDAAGAMRRSAADGSAAGARDAADRLDRARRLLERSSADRLAAAAADAQRRAADLAAEQAAVEADARDLAGRGNPAGAERDRLLQRKDRLAAGVAQLEHDLDAIAGAARGAQRDSARPLADAAKAIRDDRIQDKIRFSKSVAAAPPSTYGRQLEHDITANLDSLATRLDGAGRALAAAGEEGRGRERALERARRLATGVEAMGQRMQDAGEAARAGGQAQPGGRQDAAASPQAVGSGERSGAAGGGPPRALGADPVRQFRREARERLADADSLARLLAAEGIDAGDLDGVRAALRRLTTAAPYRDPAALARLQADAVQRLKEFEFSLRRRLQGDDERRALLSGSREVPERFRKLVEEYFRSLAGSGNR